MRTFLCLIAALALYATSSAQDQQAHALYAELAGTTGLYSFNYEYQISKSEQWSFPLRTGLSVFPTDKRAHIVVPFLANVMYGKTQHKAEAGLGIGVVVTTQGQTGSRLAGSLGYRFITKGGKYFYRLTYTPLASYKYHFQYQHWGGFSIGWKLGTKPAAE